MKIEKLNTWISLGANLGVLLGIVFLSMEISQSNRIALGNSESQMRALAMEFSRGISQNDDLALLMAKLTQPNPELSPMEQVKAGSLAIEFLTLMRSAEALYKHQLISDATFDSYLNEFSLFINGNPGFVPIYAGIISNRQYTVEDSEVFVFVQNEIKSLGY